MRRLALIGIIVLLGGCGRPIEVHLQQAEPMPTNATADDVPAPYPRYQMVAASTGPGIWVLDTKTGEASFCVPAPQNQPANAPQVSQIRCYT